MLPLKLHLIVFLGMKISKSIGSGMIHIKSIE